MQGLVPVRVIGAGIVAGILTGPSGTVVRSSVRPEKKGHRGPGQEGRRLATLSAGTRPLRPRNEGEPGYSVTGVGRSA